MPKTVIELPRDMELKDLKIDKDKKTITLEHRILTGQSTATVAYLKCVGDGGMESTAIISVSGNTGKYSARNSGSEANLRFDLPPGEFEDATAEDDDEVAEPQRVKED